MIVPGRADHDGRRICEWRERAVPLRGLDPESPPLEGFGEAAIAEAQLRPGPAGGENDARDASILSVLAV